MKKTIFVSLFLLACIFSVDVAQAVGLSLETSQQIYRPGDTILVTADIYNDEDSEVDVVLECLLTSQTKTHPDILVPYSVTLGPDKSQTVTLYETYVTEDFPSDEYQVVVRMLLGNIAVDERETTFLVEGTLKEMEFEVRLCKEGEEESRVFIQGDSIYINYESPIESIQVEGTISFPNESALAVVLPTVLQAAETGSYVLLTTASKEGYKSETKQINFAVIEEKQNIPFAHPNQPPEQPVNILPNEGASDVSLTPTLESSAFSDPDTGDSHVASQWQITTTSGDYASPIFDSGSDSSNRVSIIVPTGTLNHSTTYYWRVRHQDMSSCSFWSEETSFTTEVEEEEKLEAFPPWIVGTAVVTIVVATAVVAILLRRGKSRAQK